MRKVSILSGIGAAIGYRYGAPLWGTLLGAVVGVLIDGIFCSGYLDINGTEGWDGDFD